MKYLQGLSARRGSVASGDRRCELNESTKLDWLVIQNVFKSILPALLTTYGNSLFYDASIIQELSRLQELPGTARQGRRAPGFGLTLSMTDSLLSDSKFVIRLGLMEGNGKFSVVRADPNSTRGWRSRYYADKEPAISGRLETDQSGACFWTFFGFENDQIELAGNNLEIGFDDTKVSINLQSPSL